MSNTDTQKVLDDLKRFVGEELKSVTYKWLSRHFNIPTNHAKQILFQFADAHRGKLSVTYLLAGWTKDTQQHVFQLLEDKQVQEAKKQLSTVTSMHVYSVQPSQPKDATDLWSADTEQASALFDSMVKKMEQNCLTENKLSAIYCAEAKRDPELATKVPAPPMAAEMKPPKQSKAVSEKIDSVMAGKTADKRGVASASMAVTGDQSQASKDALTQGPNSAPAQVGGTKSKQGAKKSATGGSKVAKMWEKAPPKADKKQSKSETQPAKKARTETTEDAKADTDMKDSSPSEEEEEEEQEVGAVKRKASKQAVFDEDSEEEETREEEPPPTKRRGSQKKQGKSEAEKPAAKRARGTKIVDSEDDIELDLSGEEPSEADKKQSQPKGKAKESSKEGTAAKRKAEQKPVFGSIKSGPATGKKRRKVTQTVINARGEEVTEEVWEDEEGDEPEGGSSNPASQALDTEEGKSEGGSQQQSQGVGKTGAAKVAAKKPAPSPAKAAAKKPAAGGKPKPAGQKGIMSFFAKK